ncbi:unnamed protein product [Penicillium olsonii]|nr:unnamed protein product [Penicillium olsonii]CAG7923004.1 unnamed protein product [Penicillium olsonii]
MSLKKGMQYPVALFSTLTPIDSHPSSAAFDVINQTLQSSEADRKDALDKAKAIVAFNLKNDKGEEAAWYLDLKNKGEVGQGLAPQGGKADVTLNLSDADFAQLVAGKANAQRLFMGGKLKIKGNIMKATKMEPILKKAQGAKPKL